MAGQEENKDVLKVLQERYEYYTGKASEINRSLALAGIAVVWIFKSTTEGVTSIPSVLVTPLVFFILTLGLDLLQYIVGGFIWWIYYLHKENQQKNGINIGKNVDSPVVFPIILWVLFVLKIVATIIGYSYLFRFLYKTLFDTIN